MNGTPEVCTNSPPARAYGFLAGRLIDEATLERGAAFADEWQVPVHQALIALGWVAEADYVRELALLCGAGVAEGLPLTMVGAGRNPAVVSVREAGQPAIAIDALAFAPDALAALAEEGWARGHRVLFATRDTMAELQLGAHRGLMLDDAISRLGRLDPLLSAAAPYARWQTIAIPGLLMAVLLGGVLAADTMVPIYLFGLAVPFLCAAIIRLVGLAELVRTSGKAFGARLNAVPAAVADADLPVYSVLVPLFDEADVLPRLVRQLSSLDYPAGLLDILLVLEEADQATRAAAAAINLPGNFRVIVVPAGGPRTKPKALNFALGLVRGSFVVVYDAEDRPEASQLRDALARFAAAGPELACVQARLNTYNPDAGFLTRGLMAHPPQE